MQALMLTVPAELIAAIKAEILDELEARPEPWVSVDAAAEHLACSRKRIYDLCAQGLPHTKDGTRTLLRLSEIDAYLTADRRAA